MVATVVLGGRFVGGSKIWAARLTPHSPVTRSEAHRMRTLLVPIEQHDSINSVLDTAFLFARRFDSYVEGVALLQTGSSVVSADIAVSLPSPDEEGRNASIGRCRELFASSIFAHGLDPHADEPGGPSFAWADRNFAFDQDIGSYGRLFDVIVLGRPVPNGPRRETLEAALFESGRSVLVAPSSSPQTLGDKVCIAWNRSSETAATVALAMPLLLKAQHVIVLSLEGWGEGPSGEELARCLERNGIRAEPVTRAVKSRAIGEAILEYAKSVHSDLLIKGAYTQSRLRQMIFGGPTSHILAHATLPVFMAH